MKDEVDDVEEEAAPVDEVVEEEVKENEPVAYDEAFPPLGKMCFNVLGFKMTVMVCHASCHFADARQKVEHKK